MVKDKEFFQSAQSACFCDRVICRCPAEDIPGDGKGDVGVLQVPDISSQLSVSSVLSVGEVVLVSSPSYFESVSRHSSVCLDLVVVSPDNLGLVDDALLGNTAEVGERAGGLVSAITTFIQNILCLASLQHLAVVFGHLHLHVR